MRRMGGMTHTVGGLTDSNSVELRGERPSATPSPQGGGEVVAALPGANLALLPVPRQPMDSTWLLIGLPLVLVAWLALVPLGFLIWQSFLTPQTATVPARFTLDNFRTAYLSPETLRLFLNSVEFAIGAAALALGLGTALAWMNERTNTPFKKLFFGLSIVPLVIPSILFTVAWIMLASPKIGIINKALQGLSGTDTVFVDIYTIAGMIFVDGLHYSPMAFLLMTAAFRAMDPSLEESALMSGASVPQVARRITLQLAWPAAAGALLILLVRAIESFEVPALLGLPVGIEVYTSSIYQAIHQYPSQVGLACAYAVTLLLMTSVGVYLQSRLLGQGARFATVTGKGFRPRTIDLGGWRYVTAALFILYFVVIVLLPFLVLAWSSLQRFYSAPSWAALSRLTLASYRSVLDYPGFLDIVRNSLLLAIASATIVMGLAAVMSWIVVRSKVPGGWLVDNLGSLPLVFPGLVLGLAIMVCYLTLDIGIYGTLWILLIAYVTRFLPYGMRYSSASMLQIHQELEESAAMSGASFGTTFRRVVLPLLKPGLLAGWIYVLIVSIRELSSSILLYSPGSEVVSVMIWELWQNGQYVELSALGVMLIVLLLGLVMLAQLAGKRFGVAEAEA
jgi:iron(III) transport system permease protein